MEQKKNEMAYMIQKRQETQETTDKEKQLQPQEQERQQTTEKQTSQKIQTTEQHKEKHKETEKKQTITEKVQVAIKDIYETGKDKFSVGDVVKRTGLSPKQIHKAMEKQTEAKYNKETKKYEFSQNNIFRQETKDAIRNAIKELHILNPLESGHRQFVEVKLSAYAGRKSL